MKLVELSPGVPMRNAVTRPPTILVTLVLSATGFALAQDQTPTDLTQASLEDLLNTRLTSVSKREQTLSRAGAAVFVLTQEEIHRSGATNLPDLLRLVPGVDVAQVDANTWAISIRGFNDRYAAKVLVLIDGRTVYTPAFSGVYWDQQDVPLEDIDRIEVIRGPGGTVWGANAMNGVINVITKSAKSTPGGILTAATGSEVQEDGLMQYGAQAGHSGAYRVFGRYFNIASSDAPNGQNAADGWHDSHGAFRSDWDLSLRDSLTVQGDLSRSGAGQTITTVFDNALPRQATINDQIRVGAGDVLGRWNRTFSNGSDMSLQVYYDRFDRAEQALRDIQIAEDVDFHHHFTIGSRQNIVWGGDFRVTNDNFRPGYSIGFQPPRRTDFLTSAFVQDEIRLTNALWFTLGSKFEHNSYTGYEDEPSAQLVWTPTFRQTVWASFAKAIQQPDRASNGINVDLYVFPVNGTFAVSKILGNQASLSAQLRDWELGYRRQFSKRLSLDVASFTGYYRSLRTREPQDPYFTTIPGPPHLVFASVFGNLAHAHTYGAELYANWSVTGRWKIAPGISLIHMLVTGDPSSRDPNLAQIIGYSPQRQYSVRSSFALAHNLDWDQTATYVGPLPVGSIPGYTSVDSRLAWRPAESVEFSVVGRNLLSSRRDEFPNEYQLDHTLIERNVYGKVTWHF